VAPVFILEESFLQRCDTGAARLQFLFDCLENLDYHYRRLGARLYVLRGDAAEALSGLASQLGVYAVLCNDEYEPFARERDRHVGRTLAGVGSRLITYMDRTLLSPDALLTAQGRPYRVYGAFRQALMSRWECVPDPLPAPERVRGLLFEASPAPRIDDLDFVVRRLPWKGGETEALRLLGEFVRGGLEDYALRRDLLAKDGTSCLSPYLAFGALGIRTAARAADLAGYAMRESGFESSGPDTWLRQLVWREFFQYLLYHLPEVLSAPFRQEFGRIQWENNLEWLEAWKAGRTGFPVVDAAMRQLASEGWMHNRARMIVASFLTKDLHIDWRWGEQFFMQQLVDGDWGNNNGGWQWAAGCGVDAAPYFRVFNPVVQGKKWDPDGDYVRRWAPELQHFPARWIHEPWRAPATVGQEAGCRIGLDYPFPIVDHEIQRHKALALYSSARAGS
jgi:deoxyribodipyrimidine photo-lyase